MSLEDPRLYQRYDEDKGLVAERLEHALNIERLRDELRRFKKVAKISFDKLAEIIARTVAEYAPRYPTGGDFRGQSVHDFLRLKTPHKPIIPRRLAFHAFMMVVDDTYREKWNYNYFVRRAGLTLSQLFATDRKADPYAHALNRQTSAGLYGYAISDQMRYSIGKTAFEHRCLLLTAPKDVPFLLAYDFDVLGKPYTGKMKETGLSEEQIAYALESWDLDARVGFYLPKRSREEGIILLNSFKWDWPTIYGSILNYHKDPQIDDFTQPVADILLTDVNSLLNIERSERTYLPSDYEVPDGRKLIGVRQPATPESLHRLSSLLERKFDWGADL